MLTFRPRRTPFTKQLTQQLPCSLPDPPPMLLLLLLGRKGKAGTQFNWLPTFHNHCPSSISDFVVCFMKQSRHRTAARQPDTWTDKQTGSETVWDWVRWSGVVEGGLCALDCGWSWVGWLGVALVFGGKWKQCLAANGWAMAVQGGDRLPSVCGCFLLSVYLTVSLTHRPIHRSQPTPPMPPIPVNATHRPPAVSWTWTTLKQQRRADKPAMGKKGLDGHLKGLLKLAKKPICKCACCD